MLSIGDRIRIPLGELRFRFVRSSGPGGQNVNKTNTKAELRWSPTASTGLPAAVRARFVERFAKRITTDGDVLLTSQRYRDQGRNAADCLEKLRSMLAEVAHPPKRRRPTRPGRAAKERRLEEKKRRGRAKRQRQRPSHDEG